MTSYLTKSSSLNSSNSDKSFSLAKTSSSSSLTNPHTNQKSTHSLKHKTISSSLSFNKPNLFSNTVVPPQFDPRTNLAALVLRSSLAYLSSQQHSYSTICTIPGCLQCETYRYFLTRSINHQDHVCHWKTCHARFPTNEQLLEHIRYTHRSIKMTNSLRFHPYLKSSMMINPNDQLPYFYPHLSLSSMTESTQYVNNNPAKKY